MEAGLLPLPRLVAWADEQILRLSEPPLWLIELSLATDEAGLRRARERVPRTSVPLAGRTVDESRNYLGCLYLAFERGLLTMARLLREAGDFTDPPSGDVPGCETFYLLLNEIDRRGPTRRGKGPLADRVRDLFAPMAREARAALAELSREMGVEPGS
jgi:hypothetical protein